MSDPSSVSGLALWLKAGDLALANGASVTSWTDSVGSVSFTNSGTAPTYQSTAGPNSTPTVVFANSPLVSTASGSITPVTLFVVGKASNVTNQSTLVTWQGMQIQSVGNDRGHWEVIIPGVVDITGIAASDTSFHVFAVILDSGNLDMFHDGSTDTATGRLPATSTAYDIGGGVAPLWGAVCEVLRYDRALTGTERATVDSYFEDKYGITVADYVPSSTAASASGSLSLSGSAAGKSAAAASGSLSLSGSATAKAAPAASGSLTLAGAASAVGFTLTVTPSGATALLSWPAQAAATGGYEIERDGSNIAFGVTATTYTDTPVGGSHTYRVGVLA